MKLAGWAATAVVLLAGATAWAGGPVAGTRVEGVITAVDAPTLQLIIADTTVQATSATVIKLNGVKITFAELAVGMTAAASGLVQDGVLIAKQITVKQCRNTALTADVVMTVEKAGTPVRTTPLTPAEQDGLIFMREEEKLAHDVYVTLNAQWKTPIFANIAGSEQTHMDAIRTLLVRYNAPDPVAGMGVGQFATAHFQELYAELVAYGSQSLVNALAVGAAIEEIDITDLFARLADVKHADIQRVYQNLEAASENHLRAFVGQLTINGVTYAPQYLDAATFARIIGG